MPFFRFSSTVVAVLLARAAARAQTGCALEHPGAGAFICYPEAAGSTANVPDFFHLSAQGNAPPGSTISRYVVQVDGRRLYENKLAAAVQRLSVEINLKSPFSSGSHALKVEFEGAGVAEVAGIRFYDSSDLGSCDPFARLEARSCVASISRSPLRWSVPSSPATHPFARYVGLVQRYGRNLESVEADIADAAAVDARGNLYVALHVRSDIELRKYAPDGGVIYDNLVRACAPGFMSISGLSVDDRGRAWIAGNTTACLPTTPGALAGAPAGTSGPHAFVVLMDTAKAASGAPIYVTYLSAVEAHVSALRVDGNGTAYVVGTTDSLEYSHDSLLKIDAAPHPGRIGFVSALNALGSAFRWSTLLPGAPLNGIAINPSGGVYVTGQVASRRVRTLVAGISYNGRKLTYLAFLGIGEDDGRAISIGQQDWVLVSGASGLVALQPCAKGIVNASLLDPGALDEAPEIAISPALDAFAAGFAGAPRPGTDALHQPVRRIQLAPDCRENKPLP